MYRRTLTGIMAGMALLVACTGSDVERAQVETVTTEAAAETESAPPVPSEVPSVDDESSSAATDDTDDAVGAMVLVMDASGSMNRADAEGATLLDGAKQALHDVVGALPDGVHAGLRVYGHRVPNTDEERGCRDTELIHPVEPLDREAVSAAIDGFEAKGFTPIGLSLEEAAADLPPEGPRSIILVSDGEDTCAPPDPCEVAARLREDGVELVIETVGFALGDDEAARGQLECIADAGGGSFHDVADAADLATALQEVAQREARRVQISGRRLEGAPIPRDANTGKVGTKHIDTVLSNEDNYYRFEIEPGSQMRAELVRPATESRCDRPPSTVNLSAEFTDDATRRHRAAPGGSALGMDLGGPDDDQVVHVAGPVPVDADEVYLKIHTGSSSSCDDDQYEVEFQVIVVEAP